MEQRRRKLSLGGVLLVSGACGVIAALLVAGFFLIISGNDEAERIPTLKTALFEGGLAALLTAYICLKHFWDRDR